MVRNDRAIINARLRQDFRSFLTMGFAHLHPGSPPLDDAWYLRAMCHALTQVFEEKERRLVINVPPRHLKSITTSVAWVAWILGHNPRARIMVASYSEDLSRQHAELCRQLMEEPWYKALFPATRLSRPGRLLDLRTTRGGMRKAVSVGGSVTGHGADIIIIDDCMKAEDATSLARRDELHNWYSATLGTRLNNKLTGAIVSIQQRLHEDDLPAKLLLYGFTHLNLPAVAEKNERIAIGLGRYHRRRMGDLLDPDREPQQVLDELRMQLGPQAFSAQYQQAPTPPDGDMVKWEWFSQSYDNVCDPEVYDHIIQSWDTASGLSQSADWSVCLTFGAIDGKWCLLEVWRGRVAMPDLIRKAKQLKAKWHPSKILIEYADSGRGLFQTLREDLVGERATLFPVKPDINKATRLNIVTPYLERGEIVLPYTAPWLPDFSREILAFPNGRHDDQVDALSQFLAWLHQSRGRKFANPERPRRFPQSRGRPLPSTNEGLLRHHAMNRGEIRKMKPARWQRC